MTNTYLRKSARKRIICDHSQNGLDVSGAEIAKGRVLIVVNNAQFVVYVSHYRFRALWCSAAVSHRFS